MLMHDHHVSSLCQPKLKDGGVGNLKQLHMKNHGLTGMS